MIEIVLLVSELQQVSERILKCADPDLKRAAITDQGTDVKSDEILGRAYGFIRRAEEREGVFRLIDDRIEVSGRDSRVSIHERKVGVHLSQHRDLRSPAFHLAQVRYRVQREVRITTEAVAGRSVLLRFANQLGQHVDPSIQQITHHVSVVAAHITLLREGTAEEAPGPKIKLCDSDVVRQFTAFEGAYVRQFGITAEEPLRQWCQEAPFQFAFPAWSAKRERSENM